MYTRHKELPVFSAWPSKVDAACFNAARRALSRGKAWLRIPLPNMAKLELILQPRDWIVVDPAMSDFPIVAWAGMDPGPGRALHDPVHCELRYYHGAAGKVAAKVPGLLVDALSLPVEMDPDGGPTVIPFRRG